MTTLWRVEREWQGETCAVLGGGPSMSAEVAALIRGRCRAIAVNNAGVPFVNAKGRSMPALAPWADVLYAADRMWWHNNRAAAEGFAGIKATVMPSGYHDFSVLVAGTHILGNGGPLGFDDRPDHVMTGFNSGYQAMHLAAHLGAKRVLLCGFDMHSKRGEHWFGDHRWRAGYASRHSLFVDAFTRGAPEFVRRGVEVINCTPGSALTCFPFVDLKEALNGMQDVREGEAGTAVQLETIAREAGATNGAGT